MNGSGSGAVLGSSSPKCVPHPAAASPAAPSAPRNALLDSALLDSALLDGARRDGDPLMPRSPGPGATSRR
ncbi:hypothetical protein [Nonomuraea coxensis]|uniref:hypothetical protein n=1 Tax=Nonomuraea coxensis TaxID=404386 RepID=UPI001FEAC156|nr:hypothetical protein [Nonomuraea coxensis]